MITNQSLKHLKMVINTPYQETKKHLLQCLQIV